MTRKNICINDSLVLDENSIWYISPEYQMLVEVNRVNGNIRNLWDLPKRYSHRHLVKNENHLYIFPYIGSRDVLDFDLDTKIFKVIPIQNEILSESENECRLYGSVRYRDSIFAFGEKPFIFQFDIKSKKFTIHRSVIEALGNCKFPYYFWRSGYVENNLLIIPLYSAPMVLIFDMNSGRCKIKDLDVKNSSYGFNCIDFDGEDYWLSVVGNGYRVVRWNKENDIIKTIDVKNVDTSADDIPFYGVFCSDGFTWLLPAKSDMAFKINHNDESIEECLGIPAVNVSHLTNDWKHNYMNCTKINSYKFLSINLELQKIVEVDTHNNKVNVMSIKIPNALHRVIHNIEIAQMRRMLKKMENLEEYYYNIKNYLDIINDFKWNQEVLKKASKIKMVGKNIYQHIDKVYF